MERTIGATDLRQRLTDVLQAVKEQREAYVIETFGRPQAVIVSLDEYALLQRLRQERAEFFQWLDDTAAQNAVSNATLSEEEVLAIIDQARSDVAAESG